MKYFLISNNKILVYLILSLLIFQACKKNDSPKNDILTTGWKMIYPRDGSYRWYDIKFKDEKTGYLITPNNLFKSVDGGNHWDSIPVGHRMSYPNLTGINEQQYDYLFFSNKKIFITTRPQKNNSRSYLISIKEDIILDSILFSDRISSIDFITQNTGYLLSGSNFYRSIDGGEKWESLKNLFSNNIDPTFYSQIKFHSSNTGWIVINDSLFSISKEQIVHSIKMTESKISWYSISAPSDLVVFMAGSNGLFRSMDGGKNVSKIITPSNEKVFYVSFSDENNGFLSSENKIYKTMDGGNSWTIEVELKTGSYITGIDFKNPNLGWVSCDNGKILLLKK